MNGDLYKNVNSQTMGSESMEGGGVEMGGDYKCYRVGMQLSISVKCF